MWADIWKIQFSSTNSNTWRDFCWKTLIRFFITPVQKSKFDAAPSCCWRDCGEAAAADQGHIFWSCPLIQPFWTEVANLISETLCYQISCSFTSLYLGHLADKLTADDAYLYKIILASAKKAITKSWLQKQPPTVDHLIAILENLRLMERMTYTLRLQEDVGKRRWQKWQDFKARGSTPTTS